MFSLAGVHDKKKHDMYLLTLNVVLVVVKWWIIQALIGRLAAREVNQEDVLDTIWKRISVTLFYINSIMNLLFEQLLQRSDIVVIISVNAPINTVSKWRSKT